MGQRLILTETFVACASNRDDERVGRKRVDIPSTGRNQVAAGTQQCGNNSPISFRQTVREHEDSLADRWAKQIVGDH